jgi:hypothetical protein
MDAMGALEDLVHGILRAVQADADKFQVRTCYRRPDPAVIGVVTGSEHLIRIDCRRNLALKGARTYVA